MGGGGGGAIEHWTLPSDIIQARGWQRGAEGLDPNGWGGHIKICFMVNFVLYCKLICSALKKKIKSLLTLEALLKKEFGEDTTMGKLPPTPRILVTGERFKGTVSRD